MKRSIIRIIPILLLVACTGREDNIDPMPVNPEPDKQYQNIILLIGDGMGLTQITGARTVNGGQLNMLKCKSIGIQSTHCADKYVTDSGASATAMSCGQKTNYYSLGVDPQGNPLETIIETLEKDGVATGLVTTSQIVHATPAAFYAHQTDRFQYEAIAEELVKSGVDFFAGGGQKYFDQRSDGINFIDSLISMDYQVVFTPEGISEIKNTALFIAEDKPLSIPEGRGSVLKQMTQKALEQLKTSKKGFFLMVEGAQIDWAGEENDQAYLMAEMLDFDDAVGVALDFAEADGNTLVVITGDHETAGFALTNGNLANHTITGQFVTWLHTAAMVPVFAFGPGSEAFAGVYENTDLYFKFRNFYGL
jgi:alkaline phosphatase